MGILKIIADQINYMLELDKKPTKVKIGHENYAIVNKVHPVGVRLFGLEVEIDYENEYELSVS